MNVLSCSETNRFATFAGSFFESMLPPTTTSVPDGGRARRSARSERLPTLSTITSYGPVRGAVDQDVLTFLDSPMVANRLERRDAGTGNRCGLLEAEAPRLRDEVAL